MSYSLYGQLERIRVVSYNQQYFLYGAIGYLILHAVFLKPEYLYILAHEVMHVIATWLSGGKVTSFRVSSKGGGVGATKSNIFIALAPYFFPFYTIIVALVYWATKALFAAKIPHGIFFFLVGLTLTFHIILTIDFLKMKQTDLLHAGYLFSNCLIYTVNLIIIGLIFSLLFIEIRFSEFLRTSFIESRYIYVEIFKQLFL